MHSMDVLPVLIVGGGPTGLTAALELSRLGVEVRIVDRALTPSTTSRALGVQARTLELLRPRGVGDDMLRLGNRAHRTALHANGRRIAAIDFTGMASEYNYILMLAQSETERLLAERLLDQGVPVERGVSFETLNEDDGCVHVGLRHPDGTRENVAATYVIAADGSHSPIRKALGLPFEGRPLEQRYVLGDVHVAGAMPDDQLSIFLALTGFLAVFPMGEGRFRFMATDPDGVAGDDGEPTIEDIQALYDRTVHIPATLYGMSWSSRFRINSRHMSALRNGRVFFGGDAAHVHSPAGGQGMNAGIQDMINLSWKLAMVHRGLARPELLDTYESDRLPVIEQLVAMTERATKMFNSTSPLAHGLLTRIAPIALSRRAVQRTAAPRLGQIAASYRGAPLAAGGGRLGGIRAGDRVPDVRTTEGRLYDVIDTARLTLLVTDEPPCPLAGFEGAVTVRRLEALPGLLPDVGWLLVRPDGYLAAAGESRDADRLTAWLGRWLVDEPQLENSSSASRVAVSGRPSSSSASAHSAVAATHSRAD